MADDRAWLAERLRKKYGAVVTYGPAQRGRDDAVTYSLRGDAVELDREDLDALRARGLALLARADKATGVPVPVLWVPPPGRAAARLRALASTACVVASGFCLALRFRPDLFGI